MLSIFSQKLILNIVNHLLKRDDNREHLANCSGKSFEIDLPLGAMKFTVVEKGFLDLAEKAAEVDVVIKIPSKAISTWPLGFEEFRKNIEIYGNGDFAGTLAKVFGEIKWDYEDDLSQLIGDILAHRVVNGVEEFNRTIRTAHDSFAHNLGEYITEEANILVTGNEVVHYADAVDELRDSVERLEQKLEQLEVSLK